MLAHEHRASHQHPNTKAIQFAGVQMMEKLCFTLDPSPHPPTQQTVTQSSTSVFLISFCQRLECGEP